MVDSRQIIGIFAVPTLEDSLRPKGISPASWPQCAACYILTDERLLFTEISALTLKKRLATAFEQNHIER
jgi:hypothetical protein